MTGSSLSISPKNKDGLAHNYVTSIDETSDGMLWFATSGGGVSRYDGVEFVNFTKEKDGLAHDTVYRLHETRDGMLWFATLGGGVSRYDGVSFVNFTTNDGLAHNWVFDIHETRDGMLWFATSGGGISRYDGEGFTTLPTQEGLMQTDVRHIYESADGVLLMATEGAGVFLYDGITFQRLDSRDFAHTQQDMEWNTSYRIHQDAKGVFWFATTGGLVRYAPGKRKPKVEIVAVKGDEDYSPRDAISLTAGTRITIGYGAVLDFTTHPQKRVYRYRIKERGLAWRNTTATSFESRFDKPGKYTFEVEYVDRDLNVSDPAAVVLHVAPPWYKNGWIVVPSGGGILALLTYAFIGMLRYLQKNRQLASAHEEIAALNEQLADENVRMGAELQVTEKIQRMILPSKEELKAIGDLDIAGYMEPADEVGGDYYDVLQQNGRLKIAIGDVTGHGMESGMVMLMTQTAVRTLLENEETDYVNVSSI